MIVGLVDPIETSSELTAAFFEALVDLERLSAAFLLEAILKNKVSHDDT